MGTHRPEKNPIPAKTKGRSEAYEKDENDSRWNFRLDRDVKGVHGDVHALLDAGVLDRTEEGRILFPYDAVHVDFELEAA